jgi:hypothetical protein
MPNRHLPPAWAWLLLTGGCDPVALLAGSVEQLAEECVVDVDGSTLHCPDRQGGRTTAPLRFAGDQALPTVLDALTASDPKVQIVAAIQLHNAYASPDALDPDKLTAADAAALRTRVGALSPNVQRRAVAFTVAASMPHDSASTRAFLGTVDDAEGRVRGWSALLKHSAAADLLKDVETVQTLTTDSPFAGAAGVAYLGAARMDQPSADLDRALCAWGMEGMESDTHNLATSLVVKRCPNGKTRVLDSTLAAAASGRIRPRGHLLAVRGLCDAPFAKIMGEPLPKPCAALRKVLETTAQDPALDDEVRGEALTNLAVDWPTAETEALITSLLQALPEEALQARKRLAIHRD